VLTGCFVLVLSLAPLLSESLGDFWSSVIFLPFWGLVYLVIKLVRRHVLAPRLGQAGLNQARRRKLLKVNRMMVVIIALVLILGLLAAFVLAWSAGGWLKSSDGLALLGLGFLLMTGFSYAAYTLDYPRFYLYGILLFASPLVGEWLAQNFSAAHHGFPIVYGVVSGIMILVGLVIFVRLLVNNPPLDIPEEH
jgi:hypothetical protein